jgi:Ca-activated chloride channel family protein
MGKRERMSIILAVAVVLSAGATLGGAMPLAKNGDTGGLQILVVDDGGPLPGATVTISHPKQLIKMTSAITDDGGVVEFPVLRVDNRYVIDVAAPGYGKRRIPDVKVKVGTIEKLTVQLAAEIAERIEVVASSPVVALEGSSLTMTFSDAIIQDLPASGRMYKQVLTMAPGAGSVEEHSAEAYDEIVENSWEAATTNPLSTFSIDVDTASYANVRRFLNEGRLPPPGSVRIEEMINYFAYDYREPVGSDPFSVEIELAEAPWAPAHRLARIGMQAARVRSDKLPLLKKAMRTFVESLRPDDSVAIVVYAGAAGRALDATPASRPAEILEAIDRLGADGSTHGSEGIRLAYRTAKDAFMEGGINRIILATDGDFNVGISDRSRLVKMIEDEAKSGVFLTVLGFGTGNLKDSAMEQLADHGNGNYAYIDTLQEARRVLVEQGGSTLVTVAKDVKIQVEFNPAQVGAYRLIGYENRKLADADFADDTKDAGEIGAGHSVTALYELVPPEAAEQVVPGVRPLKYAEVAPAAGGEEALTVSVRYKQPDGSVSKLMEFPAVDDGRSFAAAGDDFRFAAAVAAFAMEIRGDGESRALGLASIRQWADGARGRDAGGYRAEFLELVGKAEELRGVGISRD